MRILLSILATVCLVGCAHPSRDLSAHSVFGSSVGCPLALERPALLRDEIATSTYALYDVGELQKLYGSDAPFVTNRCISLPAGTPLQVHQVRARYSKGFRFVEAIGSIRVPEDKPKRFTYIWAQFNEIRRAPWEKDSVPPSRSINESEGKSNKTGGR